MASPPRRPPAAPTQRRSPAQAEAAPDLLHILVAQRALTGEQADKVRRAMKIGNTSAEQTLLQLGILSEVQVAQAVAAHAGLRYVKINPLDLDLEVVTKALSGPFARRHGMVAIAKTDKTLTVAVHDPFRAFPDGT